MNKKQSEILSDYVLHSALHMLTLEEQSLKHVCTEDLSLRELHVLEAASSLSSGGMNTMAEIAKYLRVTPASLTAAVNVLVKKGYLYREYNTADRRVIRINLTERGLEANSKYLDFIKCFLQYIGRDLDEETADKMIDSLMKAVDYFERASTGDASFDEN